MYKELSLIQTILATLKDHRQRKELNMSRLLTAELWNGADYDDNDRILFAFKEGGKYYHGYDNWVHGFSELYEKDSQGKEIFTDKDKFIIIKECIERIPYFEKETKCCRYMIETDGFYSRDYQDWKYYTYKEYILQKNQPNSLEEMERLYKEALQSKIWLDDQSLTKQNY